MSDHRPRRGAADDLSQVAATDSDTAWDAAWQAAQPVWLDDPAAPVPGRHPAPIAGGANPADGLPGAGPLPLSGLRILDLSRLLPGPMATRYLCDLGAQVLKVEPPVPGQPDQPGDDAAAMGSAPGTVSLFYRALNRGKRRLALDLKQPQDLARLREWVTQADAVVEGFRPGVMQRLGLDFPTLQALNPAIVLTSISGYGQHGPDRLRAGHDINYLALAGALDQTRAPDGQPAICNLQVADLLGGAQQAALGTLAGILGARLHGHGRWMDVSMTDAVRQHMIWAAVEQAQPLPADAGQGLLGGGVACYNLYRTADGRWMAVGALELKFWRTLCDALGRPDWAGDHWSLGQVPGSPQAQAQIQALRELFGQHTQAHWVARLGHPDACVTPVLEASEALFGSGWVPGRDRPT